MTRPARQLRPAFSLLEVAVVLLVIGIVAISAAPSIGAARDVRAGGVLSAVERHLIDARARAVASGRPHGVRIDPQTMLLETVWIPAGGAEPRPVDAAAAQLTLRLIDPAVTFGRIAAGDATGSSTFWFGFDGRPESRDHLGAYTGPWVSDGEVRIGSEHAVHIARSGAVHR